MADERKGAVTLRGNPITLGGPEIKAGQSAPDFTALDNGLKPVKLSEAKGKVVILSSVPDWKGASTETSVSPTRAPYRTLAPRNSRCTIRQGRA